MYTSRNRFGKHVEKNELDTDKNDETAQKRKRNMAKRNILFSTIHTHTHTGIMYIFFTCITDNEAAYRQTK